MVHNYNKILILRPKKKKMENFCVKKCLNICVSQILFLNFNAHQKLVLCAKIIKNLTEANFFRLI